MSITNASQVYITAGGVERQEEWYKSIDIASEGGTTVIMGPNNVLGTSTSPSSYTIEMPLAVPVESSSAINYSLLFQESTPFVFTYHVGYRVSNEFHPVRTDAFSGCRVSKISESHGADGEVSSTVSITAETRTRVEHA